MQFRIVNISNKIAVKRCQKVLRRQSKGVVQIFIAVLFMHMSGVISQLDILQFIGANGKI